MNMNACYKKIISAALCVSSFMNFAMPLVNAEDNIAARYNSMDETLFVEGNLGIKKNSLTTITFMDNDSSDLIELSDTNTPKYFSVVLTNENGYFESNIKIPENLIGGKVKIYVSNESGESNTYFMYPSKNEIILLLPELEKLKTTNDISNFLMQHCNELGIEESDISPICDETALILGNLLITDKSFIKAPGEFLSVLNQCIAAAMIKSGYDIKETVSKYCIDIDIDISELNSYRGDIIDAFYELLRNSDLEHSKLSEITKEIRVLSFFKASKTWSDMKLNLLGQDESGNIYVENWSLLDADLTYYNKISNVNEVYKKLFSNKDSIKSFDEIKLKIATYAKEIFDGENKSGGTSGGGTSSGGGDSGKSSGINPGFVGTSQENEDVYKSFSDIKQHWAKEHIDSLAKRGIITGYENGTFAPDNYITRAEFVTMLVSALDLQSNGTETGFTDVPASEWFYTPVTVAFDNGLIKGTNTNKFSPNNLISRQDASVILYRGIGCEEKENDVEYSDDDSISEYARAAVNTLSKEGIITGMGDGNFYPHNNLSRAQAAALFDKMLKYLGK